MPARVLVVAAVLTVTGCAGGAADTTQASTTMETSSTAGTVSSTTEPPRASGSTTTEDEQGMDDEQPRADCQRLTGFEDDEANGRWQVVNDDVMGGRSDGGLSFAENLLIFEGDINTNGGGFSSLRLPLEPGALVGHDRVELRARPDGRTYMITFDDDLPSRDRRVSHRSPITFDGAGEWQTVSVTFDDLFPAIFGRPIEDLPFREDLASRLGLMISDGLDGPFRIEVDWIDLCGRQDG